MVVFRGIPSLLISITPDTVALVWEDHRHHYLKQQNQDTTNTSNTSFASISSIINSNSITMILLIISSILGVSSTRFEEVFGLCDI